MVESSDVPPPQAVDSVLSKYQLIPIAKVKPSRHQARKKFDEDGLKALAASIKEEGLIEPIVVRPVGEEFELISGERRLRACKLNGMETIEAKVIQTVSEAESAAKGLIENLQREDLNPIEEAEGFQELLDMKDEHWTQTRIAQVTGKQQSHVSEALGVLKLPVEIVEIIRQRIITLEHGVELLRINNANSQKGMANKIVKGGWSVKKTRETIDALSGGKKVSTDAKGDLKDPLVKVWNDAKKSLSHVPFSIDYTKKGHWTIKVTSNKELDLVICDFAELISGLEVSLQQFRNKRNNV